jgi:multidrug efflux pump subunit AcrB
MIRYFADHPTAANVLMIAIIILGIVSLPALKRETFPEIKPDKVQVTVVYPGASANEVEKAICNRLENATDGISFLEEQQCVALDNTAIMTLTMIETASIKQFLDDVKSAVDEITDFPAEAEDPIIKELGRTETVVVIAVTSNLTWSELKALAENYRDKLLALPKVPIVEVSGFSEHEFIVLVKPEVLHQYRLSIEDIARLIRSQAIDLPAGTIKSKDQYYQIRFNNERTTVKALMDLVITFNDKGGRIRLGDIATVKDSFQREESQVYVNGKPAALLTISKNRTDDTLEVYQAVKAFVDAENAKLPASTRLVVTRDVASIVQDRLNLLLKNGWQGLFLATLALFLFFTWRYTIWVAAGLPISFLGGLVVMSVLGVSINMISMVALLMAIGILMDDAIVISESIETEFRKGKSTLQAAVDGVRKVARGVISSFITSAILFGSLLFLQGEMGQIMRILPMVLLSVLTISLLEAFLILPHHLKHSLDKRKEQGLSKWRQRFEAKFENLRERVGRLGDWSIRNRYLAVGSVLFVFIVTVSLVPSGILKFKAFPDIEGNIMEARVLMPQGTPFAKTREVVESLVTSLKSLEKTLPREKHGKLVRNVKILYGQNQDAGEEGPHLATISLDLLEAEKRVATLSQLKDAWEKASPTHPEAVSIQFKEPTLGPAGQAISIRLIGENLKQLTQASWELQRWLKGYKGVSNIMDDLRPGKPNFSIQLLPNALSSGVDVQRIASQIRAAYQGVKVSDVYKGREAYEINVKLDASMTNSIREMATLPIVTKEGKTIPLNAIARLVPTRDYSRIVRINHRRTVTVTGDVDAKFANTIEVIRNARKKVIKKLEERFPNITFQYEGEVKRGAETNRSVLSGFLVGILGVYLLLSLQFRNYREPIVVLINIPLALTGVILGHIVMGLDLTMPSIIGFVSLAGVVVNDSILLVEFVKYRSREGLNLHDAASQAVRDRFRAIFLTSITTVAGMLPLLSETSLQAQVLVPLVASVVFGMIASTFLILLVLPASYAIFEDLGFLKIAENSKPER